MNKLILIITCIFLSFSTLNAQNLNKLKNKREKNQKELKYTNTILKKVKKKKSSSLGKLHLLRKNIKKRARIVALYNREIKGYQKQEKRASNNIASLSKKQQEIEEVYSKLLKNIYFKGFTQQKWLYIFSSDNFKEAYHRYKYYDQFSEHVALELNKIRTIQDSIGLKRKELTKLLSRKEELKKQKKTEQRKLENQKRKQQSLVSRLKRKERSLLKTLKIQKKRDQQLAAQIQRVIRQNAKRAQGRKLSQAEITLGNSFASNKGKLPWPLKGVIFSKFGTHKHPILKKVKIRNDGIDIATTEGTICKSIFKGEVSKIFSIPGLNSTVIIKHGNYLSVYANLSTIMVKKGEQVSTSTTLGKVANSPSNDATILKLQIWKGKTPMNPSSWLRRR